MTVKSGAVNFLQRPQVELGISSTTGSSQMEIQLLIPAYPFHTWQRCYYTDNFSGNSEKC